METFSCKQALRYGWEKTNANLRVVLPIAIAGAVLAMLQNALARSNAAGSVLALAVQVAQAGVTLAFVRVALRLHDGQPPGEWKLDQLLAGFWPFLFTTVLYALIVAGGTLLLIVPGILWAITYGFATFAVVDGKRNAIEALRESRRLTAGRRGKLFELGLLLLGVNILGALALGIGLLVTVPTSVLAAAWVFRWLQEHAVHEVGQESRPLVPAVATAAQAP